MTTAAVHVPLSIEGLLLALSAIFVFARLFGSLAEKVGQPAVLGELLAGLVVGKSLLRLVNPATETIHMLAELGVILLLFEIGLETDVLRLLKVGKTSLLVAIVGVAAPFGLGFAVGRIFGFGAVVSIFLGASLTATSVGITARVLSDLGRLEDRESQIILGAAVIDDVLGLIILAVVGGMASGTAPSLFGISRIAGSAIGFVILAFVLGSWLAPRALGLVNRAKVKKSSLFFGLVFAFLLAYLAEVAGSAMIVGAFAAGLVLARTGEARSIEKEVRDIAHFFVPIFFVAVGAAIDIRSLDPRLPEGRTALLVGSFLVLVGVAGKLLSGLAASGSGSRRLVIGVGMIPRGEVGLIFAKIGLASAILTPGLYGAVAMMTLFTTFVAPPWLRMLVGPVKTTGVDETLGGVADLATNTPFEESTEGDEQGTQQ